MITIKLCLSLLKNFSSMQLILFYSQFVVLPSIAVLERE